MLVIGINPVLEILKSNPVIVQKIIIQKDLARSEKFREINKLADKLALKKILVPRQEFIKLFSGKDKSGGISQGILAEINDFIYSDEKETLGFLSNKDNPLLILLDEIQDPHNLGAIIRTSAATGADAIFLTEKNTAKVNHTVIKTSAGTAHLVKIIQSQNIYKTIQALKDIGITIIGSSLKSSVNLYDTNLKKAVCIIFGNEQKGIRKNILKLCDETMKIPLPGKAESLNVSVSAGVIVYEALRQRL